MYPSELKVCLLSLEDDKLLGGTGKSRNFNITDIRTYPKIFLEKVY